MLQSFKQLVFCLWCCTGAKLQKNMAQSINTKITQLSTSNKAYCVSSIRKICDYSSVCFPGCLADILFFTSLPFSHAVKLNADIIALLQSPSCLPCPSQSANILLSILVQFCHSDFQTFIQATLPPPISTLS